jgi:transcriptional pleiotropic regulator of transition state genes
METHRGNRGGKTTTGIIRNLDELGRIVIPIEIRKRFGLTERDALEISVKDQTILLTRPRSACVFCGSTDGALEHRGQVVCNDCVSELSELSASSS